MTGNNVVKSKSIQAKLRMLHFTKFFSWVSNSYSSSIRFCFTFVPPVVSKAVRNCRGELGFESTPSNSRPWSPPPRGQGSLHARSHGTGGISVLQKGTHIPVWHPDLRHCRQGLVPSGAQAHGSLRTITNREFVLRKPHPPAH